MNFPEGFELVRIDFHNGKKPLAVVLGKDPFGNEAEYKIPLDMRFRRDRKLPATLGEMYDKARLELNKFCIRSAEKLDKSGFIQRARMVERSVQKKT